MHPCSPDSSYACGTRAARFAGYARKVLSCLLGAGILLTGRASAVVVNHDRAGNQSAVSSAAALPSAVASPLVQLVSPGGTARFSASLSGGAVTSMRWSKGAVPVSGAAGAQDTLTITNASAADDAVYSFTAVTPSGNAVSNTVRLYLDSDGDGLADSWEQTQFGNLLKSAAEDSDSDGVTNAEEFQDGTNAALASARFFRLTLESINGRISVNPPSATGRYAAGTRVSLQAQALPGWQFRQWTGSYSSYLPSIALVMSAHTTLAAEFFQPATLSAGTGGGAQTWATGGNALWQGQGQQAVPEGRNLVQAGDITHGQQSWIETTVTGPATISWWWKVSCEKSTSSSRPGDWLRCEIDGELVHSITGDVPWQPVAKTLRPGLHTVRWIYIKDAANDAGEDTGWIDKVSVLDTNPQPLADAIDLNPSLTVISSGTDVWTRQTAVTHDGSDALQSPFIPDNEETWVETTVTGPGMLRFWWKVSSEAITNDGWNMVDGMNFFLDGVQIATIYGEQDWAQVEKYLDGTVHKLRWRYIKDYTATAGADAGWIDQVSFTPSPTLAAAIDNTALAFSTGGSAWIPDGSSAASHDGVDFARSGPIGNLRQSWVETTVTGPGTISFWWNVSSDSGDLFRFLVDGNSSQAISGSRNWTKLTRTIPSGVHSLRWSYDKDASGTNYQDTAFLDQVVWTPGASPLGNAVDAPALDWVETDAENNNWIRQTAVIRDGSDAAQAGPFTTYGQTARMRTTVTGPGQLTFWWKCSCATTSDTDLGLRFLRDGVLQQRINGIQDWVQVTRAVPPGVTQLTWEFVRPSASGGTNSAWVDAVSFTPAVAVTLAAAADTGSGVTWTTGGQGTWSGYNSATASRDGVDVLASPTLGQDESSWIEATVNGPGTVNFRWRVSSRQDSDIAEYFVDGNLLSERSGEIAWQPYVTELTPGPHTLRWRYTRSSNIPLGDNAAYLDQVAFVPTSVLPLTDAIDHPGLSWHSSIHNTWFRQTAIKHDGTDAAQSGPIGDNEATYVGGFVTGPGVLTFWWKVSAESGDYLRFYRGSGQVDAITGNTDWTQVSTSIPAGSHFCWWSYQKDYAIAQNSDAAWLDQVVYTPNANAALAAGVELPAASPFYTGGSAGAIPWNVQTAVTHDGVDALKAPVLGNSQEAWFESTVNGPGVLSFWYKVSSELDGDYLEFWLDDTEKLLQASGEVDWRKFETDISPGSHRVFWRYRKDSAGVGVQDSAWVDQVTVIPHTDLAAAVDTALPLTTGGAPWVGLPAATLSRDGVDHGGSGLVSGGQESWMQTTVTGPGTLSFAWKISAYPDYDFLRLIIDGTEVTSITQPLDWQNVQRTLSGGSHTVRWSFLKGTYSLRGKNRGYVDQIAFAPAALPPLADAVDQPPAGMITASGDAPWFRQTSQNHDSSDAAQSGPAGHSGHSWMETTVTGPGILTYWWRVSCQQNGDYLRFYIDGADQNNPITGETAWQAQSHFIPAGSHTARWRYVKNSSVTAGSDAGWVDQIAFSTTVPLGAAVDNTAVTWTTGGALPWLGFSQPDGITDEATTGYTRDAGNSWIETKFTGPGSLTFNWRNSGYSGDNLTLSLDDSPWSYIRGSALGWQPARLTIPAGTHTVRWTYVKNSTSSPGEGTAGLDQVTFASGARAALNDAADDPSFTFYSSGNSLWDRQTATKHDGTDAAQSGTLTDNQTSSLFTQIQGPGVLAFWWKVSSQASGDYLRFYGDAEELAVISGEIDWRPVCVPVPDGVHTFEWRYTTNSSTLAGQNRGWLDQLAFQAGGIYPLNVAFDSATPVFSTGPASANAAGVSTAVAHDLVDMIVMPADKALSTTWLETVVQGPVQLKFWWRADYARRGRFLVDGAEISAVTASTAWSQIQTNIDTGSHVLRWEAVQLNGSAPWSALWLDELTGMAAPAVSPFQQWQTQTGLSGTAAAALADPDKDMLPNVIEFAYNLDPLRGTVPVGSGTTGRLPVARIQGGGADARLVLEFLRRRNSGLIYIPRFSDDPQFWSTATGIPSVQDAGNGWELVTVPDTVPLTGRRFRFGTVRVTLP